MYVIAILLCVCISVSGSGGSVPRMVARLRRGGFSEELAWLEAYLADEASDRAMDGRMM